MDKGTEIIIFILFALVFYSLNEIYKYLKAIFKRLDKIEKKK